jgi:hypothetical protein
MSDIKFAVMSYFDFKEDCQRIIFLQYNGNEENLKKLADTINNHDQTGELGDSSRSVIDINNLVSEVAVDEMCTVNTFGNYYDNHLKLTGTMKPVIFNIEKHMSRMDIMLAIDTKLYKCQIEDYFE